MKKFFLILTTILAQISLAQQHSIQSAVHSPHSLSCNDSKNSNSLFSQVTIVVFENNPKKKPGVYEYGPNGQLKHFHPFKTVSYESEKGDIYKVGYGTDGISNVKIRFTQETDRWGGHYQGSMMLKYNGNNTEPSYLYGCSKWAF